MARIDTDIVHFNARVRGMKSRLFSAAAIREMLDQDDLARVIETLLESPYGKEMAEALTRYQGADAVEDAVSRNFTATCHLLIDLSAGDAQALVRLLLVRDDLRAVKSLLRCRHQGIEAGAAKRYLIAGPMLTAPIQEALAQCESMDALVSRLVAWNEEFCFCLQPALAEYAETNDLPVLEEALDYAYFVENARRMAKSKDPNERTLCRLLRFDIDQINLRALFQFFGNAEDKEVLKNRLLPEGLLAIPFIQRMATGGDPAGAMELLTATPYRALVEELYQLIQTQRFAPMERFFDHILLRQLRRAARQDVLGLSVVMEYEWLKYNEMLNLRLVARGLDGHLPKGRVREELNLV